MLPKELLRKVRMIEITTRKVVNDVVSGQYRSHFKGQGMQFSEHRLYMAGDDVRHIDWKVSARSRDPMIKKFEEERELTVFLVVDVSGSESFGSSKKLKSEVAAEIGGVLACAASHTGDKVGVLLFSDRVEKIIPPKKGRQHVLRVIREILGYKAKNRGTDLGDALESAGRIMKHSGVIFVISDFIVPDESGFEIPLKRLARKHDVIAVSISDERESQVPDVGQILFVDPETGLERLIDTSSYAFKKWIKEARGAQAAGAQAAFKAGQIDQIRVLTKEEYGDAVVRFFAARARRRSR